MRRKTDNHKYRDTHMLIMFGFCEVLFLSALIWFPLVFIIDGVLREPVAVIIFELAFLTALIFCIYFGIQYMGQTWIDEEGFHISNIFRKRNRSILWSEAKELGISVVPMGASAQYYIYLARNKIPYERKHGQIGMKKSDHTWDRDAIRIPLWEDPLKRAETFAPDELRFMLQTDSMYQIMKKSIQKASGN